MNSPESGDAPTALSRHDCSVISSARTAIATSLRLAESGDISTAWFALRDLEATRLAGLSGLAWTGHNQGDITENELRCFIRELEEWMDSPNAPSSDTP